MDTLRFNNMFVCSFSCRGLVLYIDINYGHIFLEKNNLRAGQVRSKSSKMVAAGNFNKKKWWQGKS